MTRGVGNEINNYGRCVKLVQKRSRITARNGNPFFRKNLWHTQVHDGFSVGMSVDRPEVPLFEETVADILFFAEESDDWFFKGLDMTVDYDECLKEPKYLFVEA